MEVGDDMEKIQVSSVYGEMMNKNVMNLTPEQIATMKERRIQLEIIINSTYGLKPPSNLDLLKDYVYELQSINKTLHEYYRLREVYRKEKNND